MDSDTAAFRRFCAAGPKRLFPRREWAVDQFQRLEPGADAKTPAFGALEVVGRYRQTLEREA